MRLLPLLAVLAAVALLGCDGNSSNSKPVVGPVEAAEAVGIVGKMRRHPVDDHADPSPVEGVDEVHQPLRITVAGGRVLIVEEGSKRPRTKHVVAALNRYLEFRRLVQHAMRNAQCSSIRASSESNLCVA